MAIARTPTMRRIRTSGSRDCNPGPEIAAEKAADAQQQDRTGDARRGRHGRDGEGRRQGHGLGPPSAEHPATVSPPGLGGKSVTGKFAQVNPC